MSDDPYQSPAEGLPPEHLLRPERGRGFAMAGLALLLAGSLFSTLWLLEIVGVFSLLAETGKADPEELAGRLALTIWLSLLPQLAGGVMAGMAVFGPGNRERWFFHFVWMVSALQLITFPLGTPIGILLLFGLLMKRKEFGCRAAGAGGEKP